MKKKVHYICHYDDYEKQRYLVTQPSAVTKINYIKSALIQAGYHVSIFSVAEGSTKKKFWHSKEKVDVNSNLNIFYLHFFGRTNIFFKIISRIFMHFQLLKYLIFFVKKEDEVIVYHSLTLNLPIKIYSFVFKNRLTYEVEELYSAAMNAGKKKIENEKKFLRKCPAKYILVNDIIGDKCNFSKPDIVCYGDYQIHSFKNTGKWEKIFDKKFIHVVYAGTIEGEGTDAFLAIQIINYLPSNYKIHILGYGIQKNIEELEKQIDILNNNRGYDSVVYDGCLYGNDYLEFLSNCTIGLCTRILDNDLSDYTFPSKILVYLGNNINVVCSKINCVEYSLIKDLIFFSENNTPIDFAKTILKVKSRPDHLKCLDNLNSIFINNLTSFLK